MLALPWALVAAVMFAWGRWAAVNSGALAVAMVAAFLMVCHEHGLNPHLCQLCQRPLEP